MATRRQTEANQLNALKSTGPTSEEGKDRSRRNALKHGLAGAGVVLPEDEAEAVEDRMRQWRGSYSPATDEAEWLFEQVVVNSVRVDVCQAHERDLRGQAAARARVCWADDRRLDAEEAAAGLARDPARAAARLGRTAPGCAWLLDRWRRLGEALGQNGGWTEGQHALALDLLGTPAEFRDAPLSGPPGEVVAAEVARLEGRLAGGLDELDDLARSSAGSGVEVAPGGDRALARLRRYEAACMRRLQWARNLLLGRARVAVEEAEPEPEPEPRALTPLSQSSRMTDDDWRAYERQIFKDAFARAATLPPPILVPDPEPGSPSEAYWPLDDSASLPSHGNRKARRAAEKLARGR